MLVLEVKNAGMRRPGYKARTVKPHTVHCLVSLRVPKSGVDLGQATCNPLYPGHC